MAVQRAPRPGDGGSPTGAGAPASDVLPSSWGRPECLSTTRSTRSRAGMEVVGVDPAEASLATARAHAERSTLRIDYRSGSGEHLPLPDAGVDMAVDVTGMVPKPGLPTMYRLVRRLKKGQLSYAEFGRRMEFQLARTD